MRIRKRLIKSDLNQIENYQTLFVGENRYQNLNKVKNLIYSIVNKLTSNPILMEEAVQESLYKITRGLNQYDPNKASFSSWIGSVTKNTTIDLLRKKSNTTNVSLDEQSEEMDVLQIPSNDDVELDVIKNQNAEQLNQALLQINPNFAEVIKMFYYDGLLQTDIAERLNIPINTVKTRLSRGKQEIKKILGEDFL